MKVNQMPNLCEGTDQTGFIKKEIAERFGMSNNCKVYGGAGDNAAAAIGLGLYEEGNVSLSLGTSGVIFGSTQKFLKNYQDAIHSFCHCIPNSWHLMSVMLSCTSNVNWFINTFDSSINEITSEISESLSNIDKIKNAPFFLPYLTGERTPINDPHVRASFHHMGMDTDRSSLIFSLIEGISFGLNDNFQALVKTGIKINNIYAIGGGSRNDYWLQILATILNKDLAITEASDAMAAYGAARIAFMGYNNISASDALNMPKVLKTISKNTKIDSLLQDRFQQWKSYYIKND